MDKNENVQVEKIYMDINPDIPINEVESMCPNCEKNGITRFLLTKIPFFKEIILLAFECLNCGYRNSEVQSASNLADYGIKYVVNMTSRRDLDRRVVKTEFAEIKIPFCGLEIPPKTQKGKLSTIEGFISKARDDMTNALNEGLYNECEESVIQTIKETIEKMNKVLDESAFPCEFILVDPSGNSFVENPYAPNNDVYCKTSHFIRTKEMAEEMGYSLQNQIEEHKETNVISKKTNNKSYDVDNCTIIEDKKPIFEVYKSTSQISAHLMDMTKSIEDSEGSDAIRIPETCIYCKGIGENRVCIITVPFFKELIITCFSCSKCFYKSSEVRGGGGISDRGTKITLKVETPEDLNRDMFKSETASVSIPEMNFDSSYGSLGSMFTTVEGILEKIYSGVTNIPFSMGDSTDSKKFDEFCLKIKDLTINFKPFTLIIDDPASNSFIFAKNHDNPENDKQLIVEEYDRSYEQNEDLGLNMMKTDNYEDPNKNNLEIIKEEDEKVDNQDNNLS